MAYVLSRSKFKDAKVKAQRTSRYPQGRVSIPSDIHDRICALPRDIQEKLRVSLISIYCYFVIKEKV